MRAYLVGGAVRDQLLGLPVVERDYVVVGATPEWMASRGFVKVGSDFPVFLHPDTKEEYALARTERKTAPGYGGFVCHASSDVSLEDDLLRRDLTINAIAQDETGKLCDPYHGVDDLRARRLRHVSDAFVEDPLRVLRVARFAARLHGLGFTVAPETQELMRRMADSGELSALTPERVWKECTKSLMTEHPEVFWSVLASTGAVPWLLPEWVVHDRMLPAWSEGNRALARAAQRAEPLEVRFASWTHAAPVHAVEALCARWRVPRAVQSLALLAARYRAWLHHSQRLRPRTLLRLLEKVDALRRPERWERLLSVYSCCARDEPDSIQQRVDTLRRVHKSAQGVQVSLLLAQGYQGAAIKAALHAARKEAVEAALRGTLTTT